MIHVLMWMNLKIVMLNWKEAGRNKDMLYNSTYTKSWKLQTNPKWQKVDQWLAGIGRGGFTLLIGVMFSWYAHLPKFIQLYTLNMCTLFHVDYISIKLLFKINQDSPLSRRKSRQRLKFRQSQSMGVRRMITLGLCVAGRGRIASTRVIMLISWCGDMGIYLWKFIQLNTYDLCIFLYLLYFNCFKFIYYKNNYIDICHHGVEFLNLLVLFQNKVSPTCTLGDKPSYCAFPGGKKNFLRSFSESYLLFCKGGMCLF